MNFKVGDKVIFSPKTRAGLPEKAFLRIGKEATVTRVVTQWEELIVFFPEEGVSRRLHMSNFIGKRKTRRGHHLTTIFK